MKTEPGTLEKTAATIIGAHVSAATKNLPADQKQKFDRELIRGHALTTVDLIEIDGGEAGCLDPLRDLIKSAQILTIDGLKPEFREKCDRAVVEPSAKVQLNIGLLKEAETLVDKCKAAGLDAVIAIPNPEKTDSFILLGVACDGFMLDVSEQLAYHANPKLKKSPLGLLLHLGAE